MRTQTVAAMSGTPQQLRRHNRRGRRLRGGESGQAIVWVAVMLPFFLSIIGLSSDGGTVFAARRELQNAADGAARAAAMQVDLRAYRESGGSRVVIDAARARQVATEYLARQGSGLAVAVSAEPQRVVVQVERDVPLAFMSLAGSKTVRIAATAPAAVRYGVERAE